MHWSHRGLTGVSPGLAVSHRGLYVVSLGVHLGPTGAPRRSHWYLTNIWVLTGVSRVLIGVSLMGGSRRALSHLCLNGVFLGSHRARHCLADPPMSRCGLTWVSHASHWSHVGLTGSDRGLAKVSLQNDHGLTRASPGLTKVSSVSPGSHRYLTGVSRVSHWSLAAGSHRCLTGVSPRCHRGHTDVSPRSHRGLTWVSLGSHWGLSGSPGAPLRSHNDTSVRPL